MNGNSQAISGTRLAIMVSALMPAAWSRMRAGLPSPRRPPRRPVNPSAVPATGILGALRTAALGLAGILTTAAVIVSFMESYRGLYEWAVHHRMSGIWALLFPLQIDVFIAVPEIVLFIATVDSWDWRGRLGAWTLALAGLGASIGGNIGHVASADLQSRVTFAVPPVAAFFTLWLGLAVIKRVIERRPAPAAAAAAPSPPVRNGKARVTAEDVKKHFQDKIAGGRLPSQAEIRRQWGVGSDTARPLVEQVSADTGIPLPPKNGSRR